jgi:hypothetical protein
VEGNLNCLVNIIERPSLPPPLFLWGRGAFRDLFSNWNEFGTCTWNLWVSPTLFFHVMLLLLLFPPPTPHLVVFIIHY